MSKMYRSGLKNASVADLLRISIFLFAFVFLTPAFALSQYKTFENNVSASSPNGKILFIRSGQIYTMNPDGSNQTPVPHSVTANSAQWSYDGTKIAFMGTAGESRDIYMMNADGSNQVRVTNMGSPSIDNFGWSPDGTKFVYGAYYDIYTVNIDGTNTIRVTTNQYYDSNPKFSPDGSKIVFLGSRPYNGKPPTLNDDICIINTDGTNEINLTHHPASDVSPVFSPDGTKIAFVTNRNFNGSEVYVMNIDGSNLTQLTNNIDISDGTPAWSPDGTKIAFVTNRDEANNFEVYVMNADGTNQTRLTNSPGSDLSPSWQRVASNAMVGGRVVTASGRMLGNVQIVMIDANGNLRTSLSNSFGYFSFDNVSTGITYNFSVSSKRYIFSQDSQDRIIISDTENINFIAND